MARTILLAFISLTLIGAVIRMPDAAFQASLQGLTVWWTIVFPGLLPFLVLFEMIAAFGLAHGLGVLMQAPMRKLFKLPGDAALPLVLGWMSGFTAGAEATADLRRREVLSPRDGQRLLALSHMPNPMFMLIVIGAGFMHRPELGIIIAAAVWLSALWTFGLQALLRRRKPDPAMEPGRDRQAGLTDGRGGLLGRAAAAITSAREEDGRGFGKVLGDAVYSGVQKLMVVGGFIIFASVVARLAQPLLQFVAPNGALDLSLPALLEGHLGAYAAAVWQGPLSSASVNAALVAAVLAWSGISAILQAGYAVSGTGLKLLPFIGSRLLHAVHAALFALLLWKPAQAALAWLPLPLPVFFGGDGSSVKTEAAMLSHGDPMNAPLPLTVSDLPGLWPYALACAAAVAAACVLLSLITKLTPPANRSVSIRNTNGGRRH
ncbi:nucleoside recognition domain-containing protein [Paenibacillus radicis (ex Gao et al. 2016)]|uniref:Sporulation integral membrane protein YlbJ n=1 Tax=Paenibacillus radicis (ex Gao et al. 2016) TaxID=1737354 RepID=A0A917HK35_9BACL|nr:nucleoside recognition domain-containing protein [Paenibacillus radicis (ex Gao et al. 2016)]GGG81144.1 sporulation integral membrane protein YlbJ [Paenibacillus radicis (ex Gao et al. 2016)]